MKTEFDVKMQYHRETGTKAGIEIGEALYFIDSDGDEESDSTYEGRLILDEHYYNWLIEKITT